MPKRNYLGRQQSFYLFLMISAYASTLGFGTYYYTLGVEQVYLPTFGAFIVFVIFGAISFFTKGLVTLFRLSIIVAGAAFYNQVLYTGGILSPAVFEFIIPPLLAFFYRPVRDRFIFMSISFACLLSFLPLTHYGMTQNLIPESQFITHSTTCGVFVFTIVSIFSVLFRSALVIKNKQIGESMHQLKATTQKLIQSEKMASLGVLSAGVAHEINNPLNFIRGGVDVLEMNINTKEDFDASAYLHVIKEGLDRASTIVNSLNHFSRQTDAVDESCELHSILDNSVIMLQNRFKRNGVAVEKRYDSSNAILIGNEGKLHQAFLNILSNAEQAIEKEGIIAIETEVAAKIITVTISDTGCGISKENLQKISDPFFTTKPPGQGTGLGLAITYRILEEHSAEIKVTSKVGKGTKFSITFIRQ